MVAAALQWPSLNVPPPTEIVNRHPPPAAFEDRKIPSPCSSNPFNLFKVPRNRPQSPQYFKKVVSCKRYFQIWSFVFQ